MNERDKKLAKQAGLKNDCDGILGDADTFKSLASLIRADERKALIHYFADHWRSDWSDGEIIEALEARGNT